MARAETSLAVQENNLRFPRGARAAWRGPLSPQKPLPAPPIFLDNRPAVRHNETEQKRPGKGRFPLWLLLYPAPVLPRKDRGKRPKKERILNQEDDDGDGCPVQLNAEQLVDDAGH